MRKLLVVVGALCALIFGALAQPGPIIGPPQFTLPVGDYPAGSTPVAAASGTVAAATATATLAASATKTTYLCSFIITSTGSTAAAVVAPTVTGLVGGTWTLTYATVAGATLANQPLVVTLSRCVPGSAVNTAVVVSVPSLGAGNTNTTVVAQGYQL